MNEPIDPKASYVGIYEEAKARIELEIKLPQLVNKGKRRIEKLKTSSTPVMLIEGKREDVEEPGEDEELEKEEEITKNKGKVIITKPPNPSTIVFTKRSRKKVDKEGSDVIFN